MARNGWGRQTQPTDRGGVSSRVWVKGSEATKWEGAVREEVRGLCDPQMPVSEARDSWLLSQPCLFPLCPHALSSACGAAAAGLSEAQAEETKHKEAPGLLGRAGTIFCQIPRWITSCSHPSLYF